MSNPNRKMCTVRRIDSVDPIEGADRIEVARVGGWSVVTGKGEYAPGDYALYFEIDTFMPSDDERFAFLASRGTRKMVWKGDEREGHVLRTAKMRGVYSQGLLMDPALWGINPDVLPMLCDEGIDMSKQVGVWEWYKPLPSADFIGRYDQYVGPRTDAVRIQNVDADLWDIAKKTDCFFSVKVDGTSTTMVYDTRVNRLRGFSHNNEFDMTVGLGKVLLECAERQGIADFCKANPMTTVQSELCGPKIQSNRYALEGHRLFVFSVWHMEDGRYLDPYRFKELAGSVVPRLDIDVNRFDTPDDFLAYVDGMRGYISKDRLDEGVVLHVIGNKSATQDEWLELCDALGQQRQIKAVSNKFLLKAKD